MIEWWILPILITIIVGMVAIKYFGVSDEEFSKAFKYRINCTRARADHLEDKLETIRKWGNTLELYPMGHSLRTHFNKLRKILEGEDLQSIGETQT